MKTSLDQRKFVEKLFYQVKRFKKVQKCNEEEEEEEEEKVEREPKNRMPIERRLMLNVSMLHTREQLLQEWFGIKEERTSRSAPCLVAETAQCIKRDQLLIETQLNKIKMHQQEIREYQALLQELDLELRDAWKFMLPLDEELYSGKSWSQLFMDEAVGLMQQMAALPGQLNSRLSVAHRLEISNIRRFGNLKKAVEYIQRKRLTYYLKVLFWSLLATYSLHLFYM
ncbi:hypothetical protein G6F56_005079 [Rhizopus delemar]|nr:hypothetical protein G6F56_005079 [Rhizopus delemar]